MLQGVPAFQGPLHENFTDSSVLAHAVDIRRHANSKDPAALKRYGVIADYMHLGGKSDEEKVDLLIAYLRKMNDDLNIPHSINHYGPKGLPEEKGFVPEEAFLERVERIAADAILDACTGSNPRQPSQEEMVKLLKCCYYDTEVDF